MEDDWPNCDAEAAVAALSVHYRFPRAGAVQLLRDQGILRPRAEAEQDDDDVEEAEGWGSEEDEEDGDAIIPMPGQDLVSVGAMVVGTGEEGFQDGAAAAARFNDVRAMLLLPDGRVLVADWWNHRIRVLSADLQQVSTVAGDGEEGHQDGGAAQAQFNRPRGLALLPDGRVVMADSGNHRIRVLSADLLQVSTVAGDGGQGHRDGTAAQAQFSYPRGLALLPDGRVLVADSGNNRIRVLSADLQQVSTVAGDGEEEHRDGAAAQAQFNLPTGFALLTDGRVLVSDSGNYPTIRVLSADLQQVSTLTNVDELDNPAGLCLLPDGRLLVGNGNRIRVLEGFPAALLGTKPSHKKPKKTNQQQQKEKKRALAGGASSTGRLVPKRSRSGASSSMAAPSSSDSEGEEQPGGSAAKAEPLVLYPSFGRLRF